MKLVLTLGCLLAFFVAYSVLGRLARSKVVTLRELGASLSITAVCMAYCSVVVLIDLLL